MSVKEISIEELKQKLEQEEAIQRVDVREDEEVAEGMIPEAVHIRMGDILKSWMRSIKRRNIILFVVLVNVVKMSAIS